MKKIYSLLTQPLYKCNIDTCYQCNLTDHLHIILPFIQGIMWLILFFIQKVMWHKCAKYYHYINIPSRNLHIQSNSQIDHYTFRWYISSSEGFGKLQFPKKAIYFCKISKYVIIELTILITTGLTILLIQSSIQLVPHSFFCICVFSHFSGRDCQMFGILISFFSPQSISSLYVYIKSGFILSSPQFSFLKITSFLLLCFSYINFLD